MKKKTKITFATVICVGVIATGAALGFQKLHIKPLEPQKSYAAVIDENFESMAKSYDTKTLMSSSPYAYIDNEYYKNIVNLGFEAVPLLQEKGESKEYSSLNSYISALAILEITDCDFQELTGTDFETAEQFYKLWNKELSEMPEQLENIVENDEMSVNEKKAEISKYGIFGEAFLAETLVKKSESFCGENCDYKYTAKEQKVLSPLVQSSKKELNHAVEYLEESVK